MRKILIIAGSAVAGLILLAVAALFLVDVNQYRGTIQAQLEKRLQRKVALGPMSLRIIPLSIRVQDASIGESPEFASSKPFLSAREMYVSVGLLALLQKRIEVNSLQLQDPDVELIKDARGKWNFSTLGGPSAGGGGQTSVSLQQLKVTNGTVAVTERGARSVYDRIDITVENYSPGKHYTADLRMHLPGKGKQEVAVTAEGVAGGADIDGTISVKEVSAGPATVSGDGRFSSRGNIVTGKGSLKATEARLKQPLQVEYQAQYDRDSGKLAAAPLTARMGGLTATGRADADTNATPLAFTGAIRSDNAPVTDLLQVANAFGAAEGVSGTGNLSLDLRAQGKGSAMAFTGSVRTQGASIVTSPSAKPIRVESAVVTLTSSAPPAGTINAGKLAFDQIALTQVKSDYRLENGVLHLDPVTAGVFGGQLAGRLDVDTRATPSALVAKARLSKVDAAQLLAATTSLKQFSGTLSGDADLKLAPPPGQDPARGLNGTVQILLTDGKIAGLRILNELASVGSFLGTGARTNQSFTNVSKLAGHLAIQNGVASTDDLQMDFDGGSLTAAGTAGLADQTLNLRITAVLAKQTSQQAGGSQVGGFMSTVLANSKGELVIPAKVTGTFGSPRFAPDPERFGKMKLAGLLPTTDNPGALGSRIQGVVGSLFGKQQTAAEPGKAAAPADKTKPFLDMLQSLGKGSEKKR